MKTVLFFALSMLVLGSCETIYEEITRIDTIFVDRPQALAPIIITVKDTVHVVDTLKVEVIVNNTDTVYQIVVKDSIIVQEIEKIITVRDTVFLTIVELDTIVKEIQVFDTVTLTVYDRTVVYLDTMVAVSYLPSVFSVPDDIIPHLEEFNRLCFERGLQANLGNMIVQYVEELPGEGWSSNSFQVAENSQIVIQLDQRFPAALQRGGMLRELSRIGLNKKYTTVPDRIMNNQFSPETEIKQYHLNDLFK